jgi:hypothetical protein
MTEKDSRVGVETRRGTGQRELGRPFRAWVLLGGGTKDRTAGSVTWSPGSRILGTPEALKRVARGAKQPRVLGTQGTLTPAGVADSRIFAPLRGADSKGTPNSPGACFARPGAIGFNASGVRSPPSPCRCISEKDSRGGGPDNGSWTALSGLGCCWVGADRRALPWAGVGCPFGARGCGTGAGFTSATCRTDRIGNDEEPGRLPSSHASVSASASASASASSSSSSSSSSSKNPIPIPIPIPSRAHYSLGAAMSSSPWRILRNGDEDVATPILQGQP